MDHLPLPINPALPKVEITYDCLEEFDYDLSIGYPKRHGWEVLYSPYGIRYLHHGEKPETPALRSFLQNWLYFGLLQEFFGTDMDIMDFVTENEKGVKIITTAPLNDALKVFIAGLESLGTVPEDARNVMTSHYWSILEHTWRVSLNTVSAYKKDVISEQFWASVAVLAESIETALYNVFTGGHTNSWRSTGNPAMGSYMIDGMKANGWCPFDVKRINCATSSVTLLHYLSNLPPPREGVDHGNCTEDVCVWMATGLDYKTKHMTPGCTCDGFENVEKTIDVLHPGDNIPLIHGRRESKDGPMSFEIVDSATDVEFVAISHVWAEGLGNPHGNSLPVCSLEWVQDMVDYASGTRQGESTPFWCDTICVPIMPKEMHTIAMTKLRHPYQRAAKVLVLDSYLYTKNAAEMSAFEIWSSIVVCSWSQRLWTFQESRLAQDVWFVFADRIVSLLHTTFDTEETPAREILVQAILLAYRGHIVFKKYQDEYTNKLTVRIMREALRGRAVSVASDESLCVFANMFLDMELVTSLPPDERMPAFWRTVAEVPIGIIFSSSKKKLTQPGLHWAPESFMGELETPHWLIEQWPPVNGHYTEYGLRMPVGGFMMSEELLVWNDSFDTLFTDCECLLRDEKGSWYWTSLGEPWNQSRTDFPGANELLCILTHDTIPETVAGDDPFTFVPGMQGVIGSLTFIGPDEPPIFKGYRHVTLHRHSPALQELHKSVYSFVERYVEAVCTAQDRLHGIEDDESEERGSDEDEDGTKQEGDEEVEDLTITVSVDGIDDAQSAETERGYPSVEAIRSGLTDLHLNPSSSENVKGGGTNTLNLPDGSNMNCETATGSVDDGDRNSGEETNSSAGESEAAQREDSSDEDDEDQEERETPRNFALTNERRDQVQQLANDFARTDETTRKLVVAHGRVAGRDEEAAILQYGMHCRFQLQMRRRNRITSFPKNAIWYID